MSKDQVRVDLKAASQSPDSCRNCPQGHKGYCGPSQTWVPEEVITGKWGWKQAWNPPSLVMDSSMKSSNQHSTDQQRPAAPQRKAARTEAEGRCRARTGVRKVRHLGHKSKGSSSAVSALIRAQALHKHKWPETSPPTLN